MNSNLLNDIFDDSADLFLIDQKTAEEGGLLKENSDRRCKKVFLNGKLSHSRKDFMEEAYLKLKFPSYFGRNWSAFNDCFKEKLWEDEDHFERYLLVLNHADELFCEGSDEDLTDLIGTLEDILEELADPEVVMPVKIVFCQSESTTGRVAEFVVNEARNSRDLRIK
jgi:RNAse (barnase) inhibitor barstar